MAHGIRQISDIEGHVVHPAANMFPMMGTEEFKSLMQDIEKNGIREKVILDADGRIVDGRNRAKAWLKLGRKWDEMPQQTLRASFPETEITERVWSANYERRHLTSEQKAASRLLHADRIGEVAKLEEQAKLDAEKARRNGQKTDQRRSALARGLGKASGTSAASAEKVVTAYKRGGRQALEAIVEKAEKGERRGTGERTHTRVEATVQGFYDSITEKLTSGQVKKLYKMLGEYLSDESPAAKA